MDITSQDFDAPKSGQEKETAEIHYAKGEPSSSTLKEEEEEDVSVRNCFGLGSFQRFEKTNLFFYISGIMCYKFALETMNACMNGIVLNRLVANQNPGVVWANMQGLNLACQCIGSLLIGPLVKRFHARSVLSTAIFCFGLIALIVPILEGSTGGSIPNSAGSKAPIYWGSWSPYIVYAIYGGVGIFHGMVELMRRVIPADIVGGNVVKLKRMDSLVHVCYEITGTIGAFFGYVWINKFGWGFAFTLLPIGYLLSFILWRCITPRPEAVKAIESYLAEHKDVKFCQKFGGIVYSFFRSIWIGGKLICSQRQLIWLIPAYTLPLVMHRYLENTLFPFFAKSNLKDSDLQTILTGGSNFGELLGALTVLLCAKKIGTPIPFIRLDVLLLMWIWILPYFPVHTATADERVRSAWSLAPFMCMISFGWAAGDVSLSAYVQSRLEKLQAVDKYTTPLGAVMSFLYVTYLVVFYCINLGMSYVRDDYVNHKKNLTTLYALIGGLFMTCCGVVTLVSTFIPKGAVACNPVIPEEDALVPGEGTEVPEPTSDIDIGTMMG